MVWKKRACSIETTVMEYVEDICDILEMQQQRWRRHFFQIMNLPSAFDVKEVVKIRQRQV